MIKTKILFMGRKSVAASCLRYLVSRPDVEVVGVMTDSHLLTSPTSDLAIELGLKLYDFDSALEDLKNGGLKFDLGISMLYWRRLRDEFLLVPSLGLINFHPAPLPEYKGTAGYNLAILEGRSDWATTAHYIDASIDTGNIIEVKYFEIDSKCETAQSIERKCQSMLMSQFIRVVDRALASPKLLDSTPNVGGKYVSRAEMEALKEVKDGDDVATKIRAFWFPPYDGAYIFLNGIKCTLIDRFILNQLSDVASSSLFTKESNGSVANG